MPTFLLVLFFAGLLSHEINYGLN